MRSGQDYERFLGLRPLNVQAALPGSRCALVSGRDIAAVAGERGAITMAANIRNQLSALGILRAARKADSFVMLELAKSEARYCGVNYANLPFFSQLFSAELGDGIVFALHMDHYAIKSPQDRDDALTAIPAAIRAGWTSVAIDASHNSDYTNLMFTRDAAMQIPSCIGLEVEVGEIKGAGALSTVQEAEYFIGGLNSWGIFPDFLAISNGSKHGTYDTSKGESEGIDLGQTLEIADAISKYNCVIAQHGISGTPLSKVGSFRKYGIHKGNVGTLWQNVVFGLEMDPESGNAIIDNGAYVKRPDHGVPDDLWAEMVKQADARGYSRSSGDYKSLNLPFHNLILSLPGEYRQRIVEETEAWALRFFEAFNSLGTGTAVIRRILDRGDWNASPERRTIVPRSSYAASSAPDAGSTGADGKDYSD
jgi:fructose-bisphosphate aldolase class II